MPQRFRVHDQLRPHFITCSIVYLIPVFSVEDCFRIIADSLKFCVENKGLRIHTCVIMPNHLHLICSQVEGILSSVIGDMKKFTSRQIAQRLEGVGNPAWLAAMKRAAGQSGSIRVWDEAFHPEQIHTEEFLRQKMDYIHNNPVKAGFVNDPCHWRYSSAGFYYHDAESPVPITRLEL